MSSKGAGGWGRLAGTARRLLALRRAPITVVGLRVLPMIGLFCLVVALTVEVQADDALTARERELVRMVRQDCGSCHGMTLQGGLGPALLPAQLQDLPVEGLAATIYYGRPGTAMPPWQRFLNQAEAEWIAERLLTEFPQ